MNLFVFGYPWINPTQLSLSWRIDALILKAAIRGHCDVLYSEGFADGRQYGGLTVRNPFSAVVDPG